MSTLKSIIFETLPDAEEYYETAEALRDLDRQYEHFTRTVWKASKQLLKFDEINRLVATEVEEKAASTGSGRSSSGSSSKSSSTSSTKKTTEKTPDTEATTPDLSRDYALKFNIVDFLFGWTGLDWEKVMAGLVAGLTAISGGIIGAAVGGAVGGFWGGPLGLMIGLSAGLLFGVAADNVIFNWDGKLDREEFVNAMKAMLPMILGGVVGLVTSGPAGAVIGLTIGTVITLGVVAFDGTGIIHRLQDFFVDLTGFYDKEWNSWTDVVRGLWESLKHWWSGLSLDRFSFKLPHITVAWQELASNSIISRLLGISALPHLGVEWYARGGIVDGATLIGAGEQGKEAIIPLERHTEWIHMVAVELKEELEDLAPRSAELVRMIPAAASAMVPYAASVPEVSVEAPDLSGLADTVARAIEALGDRPQQDAEIRVYLDGRQLTDVVTRYQRRTSRANGV